MPLTSREIFLILRAKDQATSVLNNFTRSILRSGDAALAASAKANVAAERARLNTMRQTGATADQIAAQKRVIAGAQAEASALDAQARKTKNLVQGMQSLSKNMVSTGLIMLGTGAVAADMFYRAFKSYQEYSRTVALTQTQVDGFKASLSQLSKIGLDTANAIAVPFEQIQPDLYDIFSSTDANLQQAQKLLQSFSKEAVAGQVSLQDASRATMGIMNAFKIPFQQVNAVLDVQFQLVRKGVGTFGQFANVIGRAVPSAVKYGQSLDTLAGSLAFLTRNGLSPAMAAASTARAMDALANPHSVANLKSLGVASFDAAGNFRPMVDVLTDLRTKIMALPPQKRAAALFEAFKGSGGTIQAMRMINQLILKPGQIESWSGFINDMSKSTGQFGKAYTTMSKTAASQTQLLKNRFQILKVEVGQAVAPVFLKIVSVLGKVVGWFNKLSPSTKRIITDIALLATAFAIVAGVALVIGGAILGLAAIFAALDPEVLAIVAAVGLVIAGFIALGIAVVKWYRTSQPVQAFVKRLKQDFITMGRDIVDAWHTVVATYNKDLKPALDSLWNVIQKKVLPVVISIADYFMNTVVKSFKSALKMITDFVKKGLLVISEVITKYIKPDVIDLAHTVQKHMKLIHAAIQTIVFIGKILAVIIGTVIVGAIVGAVVVIGAMIRIITATVHVIEKVVGWFITFYHWIMTAVHALESANTAVDKFASMVYKKVSGLKDTVMNFFTHAGGWLTHAGGEIISGLISGIENKIGKLTGIFSHITSMIPKLKGPPVKDKVLLTPAGQMIMEGFIRGVVSRIGNVKKAMQSVNNMIAVKPSTGQPQLAGPVGSAGFLGSRVIRNPTSKQITNHITIKTPGVVPKKVAADLGWELANRM